MKITVTGSLGNIGRPLVSKLVLAGHDVNVISSDPARAAAISEMGAKASIGSVDDLDFMTRTLSGSDAVFLMIPPNPRAQDPKSYIRSVGEGYCRAVRETGIGTVVNLSSVGAHLEDGAGPTGPNWHVEQELNRLTDRRVLHLRPGMFLTNFYGAIPMIRNQRMMANNFDGAVPVPLTHPDDIANAAFEALTSKEPFASPIRYVVGDVKSGNEIATLLGSAIGEPIRWQAVPDEVLLAALMQNGFPEAMARVYIVEIGAALREPGFLEDYHRHASTAFGGTSLEQFAQMFAGAYHHESTQTA